jgi:hypothetical protein
VLPYTLVVLISIYKYLNRLSIEKWEVYRFLVCSKWGVYIQSRPHTIFLIRTGPARRAGTEDPKIQVL